MSRGESSINSVKSHLAKGEWDRVIEICQQVLALNPAAIDLCLYLAKAYVQKGNISAAINSYQKILGTTIDQAEVYAELGLLHSKQKNLEQAAWHYEQALALRPEWAELQYNLAVVLHQSNNWNAAIAAYNQAIEIRPNYGAAYFNLGVLYDQKGELDIAIASYERAIAVQPNFVRAYSNLGSTLARQKNYQRATAVFHQGIKLDPTWATLHNNLGQVYWFDDRPGLAINSFENAIALDPKMALAYHNLAKLWQQQGNYPQAIKCYRTVIDLEPQNILAYSHCSDAEQKLGNITAVFDLWCKAIDLKPDFINAYCRRMLASEPDDLLGEARVSCARFLKALQQNKRNIAYYHLGLTYSQMGDVLFEFGGVNQAENYYQKALQIEPKAVELYLKLGNCLTKQKRLNAAIAIYQAGLTLEPEHPQISFQLAKVLERNQPAQASDYHQTVSTASPTDRTELPQESLTIKDSPIPGFVPREWDDMPLWVQAAIHQETPLDNRSASALTSLDRQFEDTHQSDNLPGLLPTEVEERLSLLPKQIYHYTQDWIRDCNLTDFSYVQVLWSEGYPTTTNRKITGSRQPETINISAPDQTSYSDCGGVNCNSCMTKLIQHFKPTQIGQNAYRCNLEQPVSVYGGLPFVVTIPKGRSWAAPQKNSWIICDALAVITPDRYLLGDLSRYYPWMLPVCPYQERNEHSIYEQENLPPVEKIEGKVALLSTLAGHVYYHWMFDLLPRIELIRRSGIKLGEIDWFVVNSVSKDYQRETLRLLGIPDLKIVESDRHPHIEATELIVPSFPGYMDWVPPGTMQFLRQTFLPKISLAKTNVGKKIYISRAKAKNRQVINETEVNKLITSQGFKTVFLEDMSVLEQAATFANAEVIIAPHGSGLTNLVFCSPNTKVVELFSPNYLRTDYWMISQHLMLQHYYLVGENFDCIPLRSLMYQNPLTEDIFVNLDSLQLVLEQMSKSA